jgi:DNA polymerase-1
MVLERHFATRLVRAHDTILLHHASESELPHSLAFLGSLHTDITSWKEERHGLDYQTDKDLWLYNAKDVVVTGEVIGPLQMDVRLKDQERIYAIDRKVQSMCVDLHRNGLAVDRAAIARHAAAYGRRKAVAEAKVQRLAHQHGMREFNPGSYQQVGELLYDKIGIPFQAKWETDSGGRGTSMQVLRDMLVSDERTDAERQLLLDLHEYRRAGKFLSSFVESLTVLNDGRVHADFNPTGTVSGRLGGGSEDNPSLLTIPSQLRDIFVASPGHIFVAADMDQIELRMIAALSGSRNYIAAFNAKEDPHALTSDLIYGKAWREQGKEQKDKLRGFAKRFSYACAYGAGNRTVLEVMRSVEGRNGGFPYLKTSLGEVVRNQRAWLGANPEIESWWEKMIQLWREQGYLADLIHGRKRFFLDGIDRNAMVNYPVQATSIALVHEATFELYESGFHFEFEGKGTGLVYQGHDQLIFECKESSAERVKAAVTRCMNRSYDFLPVKFTSTAKVGKTWADLK